MHNGPGSIILPGFLPKLQQFCVVPDIFYQLANEKKKTWNKHQLLDHKGKIIL